MANIPLFNVATLAFLIPAAAAHANEWYSQFTASSRTEYNDNYRFSTLPHRAEWVNVLYPSVAVANKADRWSIAATGGAAANSYAGENRNHRIDPRFSVIAIYSGERYRGGIDIAAVRDSTLANAQTGAGVILADAERNSLSMNPTWQFSLTERVALNIGYGLTDVSYGAGMYNGLFNYQNKTLNADVGYQYSSMGTANASINYFQYRTRHTEIASKGYNALIGFSQKFTERLAGTLNVGEYRTSTTVHQDISYCPGRIYECYFGLMAYEKTTVTRQFPARGYSGGAMIEGKLTDATKIQTKFDRSISPSGAGAIAQTDKLMIYISTQWFAKLDLTLDASVYRSKYSAGTQTINNSRYYAVSPLLRWNFKEAWSLESGVRRARLHYDSGATIIANAIFAGLRYDGHKNFGSRRH
ncbi:MAG: hypothetical protein AABY83_10855 [Pseudomonadota bacterium]